MNSKNRMNYYGTNIYYLMYAGSIIKIKMRQSHAFYHLPYTTAQRKKVVMLLRVKISASRKTNSWSQASMLLSACIYLLQRVSMVGPSNAKITEA